jgi:ATP-grasp domain
VALDSFYIGNLKGVGKCYQLTALDTFTRWATVMIIAGTPTGEQTARFVAHWRRHGYRVRAVLTDNGPEDVAAGFKAGLVGPLVVVGAGGMLVEVLADRRVGLPPLDAEAAERMIADLRVHALLAGARGNPPADRDAVARAVVAVSTLALELGDAIEALDVNPLRAGPSGVVALDVLVVASPRP